MSSPFTIGAKSRSTDSRTSWNSPCAGLGSASSGWGIGAGAGFGACGFGAGLNEGAFGGFGAGGIPTSGKEATGLGAGVGFGAGAGSGIAIVSSKTGSLLVLLVISSIAFCKSSSVVGFGFIFCPPSF